MIEAEAHVQLRAELESAVYQGVVDLDEKRFGRWLDATALEFRYRIEAYSPELKKTMTWLDHDRNAMAALIELLPKHHVDGADWLRQVTLYTVTPEAEDVARAVSSLAVFHTQVDVGDAHVDGGTTRLFAVGRYHDRWRRQRGAWRLAERTVVLQTRQLGIGSHLFP